MYLSMKVAKQIDQKDVPCYTIDYLQGLDEFVKLNQQWTHWTNNDNKVDHKIDCY